MNKRQLVRLIIETAKTQPCLDCGRHYPSVVMDFDHLHDKSFNIAEALKRWISIPRLMVEIRKCEIVCSNCHRIRTHERRIRMTEVAKQKLTREQVTELLRKRVKADGTPFKPNTGPRRQRTVSKDGLKTALQGLQSAPDTVKVDVVKAFGLDGRRALRELMEDMPEDASLSALFKAAFPGASTGRPYGDTLKASKEGKVVVSGFDSEASVHIERNADGSVTLTPASLAQEAPTAQA